MGHIKSAHGPRVARGPLVGQHCSRSICKRPVNAWKSISVGNWDDSENNKSTTELLILSVFEISQGTGDQKDRVRKPQTSGLATEKTHDFIASLVHE